MEVVKKVAPESKTSVTLEEKITLTVKGQKIVLTRTEAEGLRDELSKIVGVKREKSIEDKLREIADKLPIRQEPVRIPSPWDRLPRSPHYPNPSPYNPKITCEDLLCRDVQMIWQLSKQ